MNKASLIIAGVAALGFSTVSGFATSTSAPINGQSPAVTSTVPGSIVVAADDSDSDQQQQQAQPNDDEDK